MAFTPPLQAHSSSAAWLRWDCERHNRCVERARSWLAGEPLILDTETTGLGEFDEIIQVAVVDPDGNALFNSLVRPSRSIPPRATRIHGLGDADVREAPDGGQVCSQLRLLLKGRLVCAYNAGFDRRMLEQTMRIWQARPPVFRSECIMELYAEYAGKPHLGGVGYHWWSLQAAAAACGIPITRAHDALSDAVTAAGLLRHVAARQLRSLPL